MSSLTVHIAANDDTMSAFSIHVRENADTVRQRQDRHPSPHQFAP